MGTPPRRVLHDPQVKVYTVAIEHRVYIFEESLVGRR